MSEFKPDTSITYGSFKADNKVQELELMAFCNVDSGEIEEILRLNHGDKVADEYRKLMDEEWEE